MKAKNTLLRKKIGKRTPSPEKRERVENLYKGTLDLAIDIAWGYYTDVRSPTFNNAYQSAIRAGYAHRTALKITKERVWIRKARTLNEMLPRAEDVLMEDLNIGNDKKEVSSEMRRIRNQTAMFVAETIGNDTYKKKQEVEAKVLGVIAMKNDKIDSLFNDVQVQSPDKTDNR